MNKQDYWKGKWVLNRSSRQIVCKGYTVALVSGGKEGIQVGNLICKAVNSYKKHKKKRD